jgi:hypothetical protein
LKVVTLVMTRVIILMVPLSGWDMATFRFVAASRTQILASNKLQAAYSEEEAKSSNQATSSEERAIKSQTPHQATS